MGAACLGTRPACCSRISTCALTLRSSSCAQRTRASWTDPSRRNRTWRRGLTYADSRIERAGVHDRRGWLVTAQHDLDMRLLTMLAVRWGRARRPLLSDRRVEASSTILRVPSMFRACEQRRRRGSADCAASPARSPGWEARCGIRTSTVLTPCDRDLGRDLGCQLPGHDVGRAAQRRAAARWSGRIGDSWRRGAAPTRPVRGVPELDVAVDRVVALALSVTCQTTIAAISTGLPSASLTFRRLV